jgi:hypothetical protein
MTMQDCIPGRMRAWRGGVALLGLMLCAMPSLAAEVALFETWRDTGNYRVFNNGVGVSSTGGDGTIENVNITGPVAKAYLYWIGANIPAADVSTDDTVYFGVEGMPGTDVMADNSYVIPFERPFAPGAFFWNANHSAFVADVTQLIQPGMNNYSITEFDMDIEFGVGLQVVYEDDSAPLSEIAIHQGHDFAFLGWNNAEELNRTDVVTHTFAPTDFDRVLQVTFFSGGGEDTDRPDQLWSLTGIHDDPGDLPDELITNNLGNVIDTNPLEADNGEEWDTVVKEVLIPAGETFASFQFESGGGSGTNTPPESFSILSATFNMRAIPEPGTVLLLGSGALVLLRRRRAGSTV